MTYSYKKKKRLIIFSLSLSIGIILIYLVQPHKIFAAQSDIPDFFRIGLISKYNNQTEITIKNKQLTIGYELNGQFYPAAEITAATGFSVVPASMYYVRIDMQYSNYADALHAANSYKSLGFKAAPAITSIGEWYIYLGGYQTLSDANAYSDSAKTVLQPSSSRIALNDGGNTSIIFDNPNGTFPQIKDKNGDYLNLGERKYRGCIEFGRYLGQNLSAVNILNAEEYLYSTVPSEMPSLWHIEALKAQAVAARTYAISRIMQQPHKNTGYDLCDGTHCQVYLGAGNESESGRIAVDSTAGQIIYYNNKPINAVFHSSSGGGTDDSENVWIDALPYLRGVVEINEPTARQWTRLLTFDELTKIAYNYGAGIGTVIDIKITKTSATGRVLEMVVSGKLGSKTLYKEETSAFFASSSGGKLDSRNFTIENGISVRTDNTVSIKGAESSETADVSALYAISASASAVSMADSASVVALGAASVKANIPVTVISTASQPGASAITIVGSGWGHGVGMSQHGAKGMAEMGYTYDNILRYYYTGTEVK